MFVWSILSSYSRLLAGVSLALMATALAGCNDTVAQKAEPPRPVLVATAHYDAETPERSFVGTIKPRIESDLGFRVAGKVAKRLVEVGGAVMVQDATELERELARLIADAGLRDRMGAAARELVRRQQGATLRTLDVLDAAIPSTALTRAA